MGSSLLRSHLKDELLSPLFPFRDTRLLGMALGQPFSALTLPSWVAPAEGSEAGGCFDPTIRVHSLERVYGSANAEPGLLVEVHCELICATERDANLPTSHWR